MQEPSIRASFPALGRQEGCEFKVILRARGRHCGTASPRLFIPLSSVPGIKQDERPVETSGCFMAMEPHIR
ncbi:hypothetical protein STEG23_001889 [Scotinomys teguina]